MAAATVSSPKTSPQRLLGLPAESGLVVHDVGDNEHVLATRPAPAPPKPFPHRALGLVHRFPTTVCSSPP
jgi:hypothetical protein